MAAASILAKVKRDAEIKKLHVKLGYDFGSGYLTDPKTQAFLHSHHKDRNLRGVLRESWAPVKALRGGRQTTLPGVKAEDPYLPLTRHGFSFSEITSPYETVRMKGPGVTLIKYSSGKLLVQGSPTAISSTKELLKKLRIE